MTSLATQVYRWLLRLYPASFRQIYGREMLQIFHDYSHSTLKTYGKLRLMIWWLRAYSDLLISAALERSAQWRQFILPAKWAGSVGLLSLTWLVLLFALAILTEFILVPWDTALARPPLGTWQRTVNDFFETPPGSLTISLLVTAISMYLSFSVGLNRPRILVQFALSNLVCVVALYLLFMLAAIINNSLLWPYPPVTYDPNYEGYHRSVFPGLVVGLVGGTWLNWQRRLRKSINNAGNA